MKNYMIRLAKIIFRPLRPLRNQLVTSYIKRKLKTRIKSRQNTGCKSFDFDKFKHEIIAFINARKFNNKHYLYNYSASSTKPTLYASAYALMTLSLVGELDKLSVLEKEEWRDYFDSHQCEFDGLFYDPAVQNDIYNDSDWWGARHLALHMISAYTDLGFRPKYQFTFLKRYYAPGAIEDWLDQFDWCSASIGNEDVDNKIMNIGCLLQFQRDSWSDNEAGRALELLKTYLKSKINKQTGMWGNFDIENSDQRSRMVQFAYHLFPLYFYDNDFGFDSEKIIILTLKTQNNLNGFGVKLNSSACEDIDSIDTLIRLHRNASTEIQHEVRDSIEKSFKWVLINQVEDGGFVFRLEEPFVYGSIETSSKKNEGAMLPTWFRTLSIAYMVDYLDYKGNFHITNCPGYEFK
jgi:hypothetical protein